MEVVGPEAVSRSQEDVESIPYVFLGLIRAVASATNGSSGR
jgi:hypothetical protein